MPREKERIEYSMKKLEDEWARYKNMDPADRGDNALLKSVVRAYRGDFLALLIYNILTTLTIFSGPLLIKKLIEYVKTGNTSSKLVWESFTSLSYNTEYGLFLVLLLILSQGLNYLMAEHIKYRETIVSTLSSNSLIAMIYKKSLRLSPATNRRFKSGDLITFVQVDVNKMSFMSS